MNRSEGERVRVVLDKERRQVRACGDKYATRRTSGQQIAYLFVAGGVVEDNENSPATGERAECRRPVPAIPPGHANRDAEGMQVIL